MMLKFKVTNKLAIRVAIFLMFSAFMSLFVYYNTFNVEHSKNRVLTSIHNITPSNTIVMLFWNSFFSDTRWLMPDDTVTFQCSRLNCVFTNQHNYLPSIELYDGIIFHTARAMNQPSKRSARQLYVFAQLESPEHTYHKLSAEGDFYNLTMTYRLDSDVIWTYNRIVDSSTNVTIAPASQPRWRSVDAEWTQNDDALMALARAKSRPVAWFVSRCATSSKREKLVQRLQDYISVDIYGDCGKLRCPRRVAEKCAKLLDNTYKFYLSFENSICTDYVTEKLFSALKQHVVPVVFGGGNYTQFAPPHSYIDAQAFSNVSALAARLLYLSETPHEYVKYFWWRRYYKIIHTHVQPLPHCELCQQIHLHATRKSIQIYRDIEHFWRYSACNNNAKIQF